MQFSACSGVILPKVLSTVLVGECSAFLASGSDPTNVRHKNNGVEQKADVVLLKQELDYCTTGCLLHIYVCTGDCMALSIRSYEWK